MFDLPWHSSGHCILPSPTMQTKADSDVEKQMAVVNGKTKLAGEYDQKEKQLAIEQRM